MKVLTVDVGTGTQDILLYDSEKTIENAFQLIMPSPTTVIAGQIREATRRGLGLVINGVLMGGGPCTWAGRDHLNAGLPVYATPDAARTFDDDLSRVQTMGVQLVSADEAQALLRQHSADLQSITFGDFDFKAIAAACGQFKLALEPDAVAIAVFDHGAAPPEISDRLFRFEFIEDRLSLRSSLEAFAFQAERIPPRLTRFEAVAQVAKAQLPGVPLILMDTGPAAALGAMQDERVQAIERKPLLLVNIGNFHTLAFLLENGEIIGTFEHHTGELKPSQLAGFLAKLVEGSLTNAEIFDSQGHGALIRQRASSLPELMVITGPRRKFLGSERIGIGEINLPYIFAVPHGDMMLAGNFGLLQALSQLRPDLPLQLEQSFNDDLMLNW